MTPPAITTARGIGPAKRSDYVSFTQLLGRA
jgi:hypothetical protein